MWKRSIKRQRIHHAQFLPCENVNPGLINHGLKKLGGYSSNSHNLILVLKYATPPLSPVIKHPLGFMNPGVDVIYPICSMYGIFTNIYPKNHPNVGKYSIDGASGYGMWAPRLRNRKVADRNSMAKSERSSSWGPTNIAGGPHISRECGIGISRSKRDINGITVGNQKKTISTSADTVTINIHKPSISSWKP